MEELNSRGEYREVSGGQQGKYAFRSLCALVMTILATGSFFRVWYRFVFVHNQTGHLTGYGNMIMAAGIYIVLFIVMGRYLHAFKVGVERMANVIASVVLTLLVVDFLEVFISLAITGQYKFFWAFFGRYFLLWLVQSVVIALVAVLGVLLYRKKFPPLQVLEIYGKYRNNLYQKINSVPYKYHVAKLLSIKATEEELQKEIEVFDAVLINDLSAKEENRILKICFNLNKRVYLVPKIPDVLVNSAEQLNLFDTPLFLMRNSGINGWQRFMKRFFDILFSGIALVILSPFLLLTALAIKIEDHGPVFYRQERVTFGGKHFMILKFRSMIVDAEKDGKPHPAGEKDDRITRVGHVIRACRVDELPQLINILRGDMSIVGPRPERYEHVEKYTKEIPEFSFREKVKGGLTGYAQVYGKYNTTALDKLKLDLIYITNYSLLLDLQIIFETVKILFQKESTEGFTEERAAEMHDSSDEDEKDREEVR